MGSVNEYNTLIELQDEKGNVERHYPITKAGNIIGLEELTEKQKSALMLLAANSFVVDDVTGQVFKIGASDGKFYFTESDVDIRDILNTITTAMEEIK